MAVKKKRTKKQIAATKKLVALNKKRRQANPKKKAKRKARAKVKVGARSRATKKRPSAELKRRRKKNTKKGYYPNPVKDNIVYLAYVAVDSVRYYYHGYSGSKKRAVFDDRPQGSVLYMSRASAIFDATRAVGSRSGHTFHAQRFVIGDLYPK